MKCRYKKIETIRAHYGSNWSELDIVDVNLIDEDLRDIALPYDMEFFQKIQNKDISMCHLPSADYSNYNFDNVHIWGCTFSKNSILPSDTDLFQKIKDKCLSWCKLPAMDYSNYNFNGVDIRCCEFSEGSILPSDADLFKKIATKSMYGCFIPSMDYSNYNFNGVMILQSNLMNFICKEIHKYDLNQFNELDFSSDEFNELMSAKQADLIKIRYSDRIEDRSIILPTILKKDGLDELSNESI